MKIILKKISFFILFPLFKIYSNKKRETTISGIHLKIYAGVFNPGLHFSTKFLLKWLQKQNIAGKHVLELGAGTGLLGIQAAKQKAVVTASDISGNACLNLNENTANNKVAIKIFQSDLFTDIPWQHFDLMLINPPYYPKNPVQENEYAWFCGQDFDYFQKLFFQMKPFMNYTSKAIMVLSEDCNIEVIKSLALQNKFKWQLMEQKKIWYEVNYLFEITLRA